MSEKPSRNDLRTPCQQEDDCPTPTQCHGKDVCAKRKPFAPGDWVPLAEIVDIIHHPNFYWGSLSGFSECKYLSLYVDTRDNCCQVRDRKGKFVDLTGLRAALDKPITPDMNENPQWALRPPAVAAVPPLSAVATSWDLLREMLAADRAALQELQAIQPSYTATPAMLDLHRRIEACLARDKEAEELLRSAKCIADRRGADTRWDAFANRLAEIGVSGVTARSYRALVRLGEPVEPIRTLEDLHQAEREWSAATMMSCGTENPEERRRADAAAELQQKRIDAARHLFVFNDDGFPTGLRDTASQQ